MFYIPQTFDFEDASGADSKAASRNGFGKALEEKTRPETLLVTKTREDNNPFSAAVFSLVECTPIMLDLGLDFSAQFVEMLKGNEDPCARILKQLSIVAMGAMDFWTQESNGTRKFFEMAAPIVSALDKGHTLYLDV